MTEKFILPSQKFDTPSIIFYSAHRCGSTYFNFCIRDIVSKKIEFADVMSHYFRLGVKPRDIPSDVDQVFSPTGYYYGCFRDLSDSPKFPNLDSYKIVFVIRDPRDVLTSFYFADKYSHPVLAKDKQEEEQKRRAKEKIFSETTIDEYVLKLAPRFNRVYSEYYGFLLGRSNVNFFKYEYIINNFEKWCRSIAELAEVENEGAISKLVKEHKTSANEDPKKHARQITPGDHINKLEPQTIKKLNSILNYPLRNFDYI